jgi:hypothetical protein
MKLPKEMDWSVMMKEFYDQFHPTVKDVEANAEREGNVILVPSRER